MSIVNLIKLVPIKVENKEILFNILYSFIGGTFIPCGTIAYRGESDYKINIPHSTQDTRASVDNWFRDYLADNQILIEAALGNSVKSKDNIPMDWPPLTATVEVNGKKLIFKDGLLIQIVGADIRVDNKTETAPEPKIEEKPVTKPEPLPSVPETPQPEVPVEPATEVEGLSDPIDEPPATTEMSFTDDSFAFDDPMSSLESFMNSMPASPNEAAAVQQKQKDLVQDLQKEEKETPKPTPVPDPTPEPKKEETPASTPSIADDPTLDFSLPSFDEDGGMGVPF